MFQGTMKKAFDHQCSCMVKNDVKRYACFVQLGVLFHEYCALMQTTHCLMNCHCYCIL